MVDRIVNTPVTVTVASIKPVQPGKKMGAIYGVDGQRWGVWGNQIDKFTEGGVYKILSYKEGDFQGAVLRTVGDFEYIGAPTQKAHNAAKANTPNASHYAGGGDAEMIRRRDIFVCGALNHVLSGPITTQIELTEPQLIELVNKLKRVWAATLGPNAKPVAPAKPVHDAELNDQIPFEGSEPEFPT